MTTINLLGNGLSGITGSGSFVGSNSPALVTPDIGTPTSGNLSNCTSYSANSLSGGTLNSGVTASSLTSVGTLTSLAVTGNITMQSSKQVVYTAASGNLTGQTSTVSSICTFTPSANSILQISGYLRPTSAVTGTIQLQVTYQDETNTAQSQIIPVNTDTGTLASGATAGGFWGGMPRTIRTNTTAVVVKTIGSFTATYDVGGYIMFVA